MFKLVSINSHSLLCTDQIPEFVVISRIIDIESKSISKNLIITR